MTKTLRRALAATDPTWSEGLPSCAEPATALALLAALEEDDAQAIRRRWPWAIGPGQLPDPLDGWRTWLFLGGRGAGKTRAGAEWIAEQARRGGRLALVGPSLHDVREVMIDGPSGLRAILSGDARPRFEASRRRLLWEDTGAEAYAFSAEDPESLRGPQFTAAWADEFCAWRAPTETLALLRLGLRLGEAPQLVVTTTPKPIRALRVLMAEPSLTLTRATTADNAAHLSPGFVESLTELYGGSSLEAQELHGLLVEDDGAALWKAQDLARARGSRPPRWEAAVVAVDPPASSTGDACGIVAAAREGGRGYVLEDATVSGLSPLGWGRAAAACAARWGASRVVAEANQGGEMVRAVLAQAECPAPVKLVHASRSKLARAAPVAALYEQGRVVHCGTFPALEEEMMAMGGEDLGGSRSPDRADALVWALTELMLGRTGPPRLRVL